MRYLGVVVFSFLLHCASTTAQTKALTWTGYATIPQPLQEIYPAVHDNQLVVAGGLNIQNGSLSASNHVHSYSAKNGWHSLADLPQKRHHGFLLSVADELLLIGGFDQTGQGNWQGTRDVLRLTDNGWVKHSTLPSPQAETNVAVIKGQIHIVGGRVPLAKQNAQWRDHSDTDRHLIWDEAAKNWKEGTPLPTARNSSCSVVINEAWYVIGGRTVNGGNTPVNQVYLADKDLWQNLAPMPQAQGGLACVYYQDEIWVFGGEYFDNGGGVYNQVWVYTPGSDSWRQQGTMPTPRHGLGAVTMENGILLVGGAAEVGARNTLSSVVKLTQE